MYTSVLLTSYLALPVLVTLAIIELWLIRRTGRGGFDWVETGASVVLAIGYGLSSGLASSLLSDLVMWVWEHRLLTVPLDTWWGLLLLFLVTEFAYYWQHRVGHEWRWFWASHNVHHSTAHLNLSAAYRLGWTARLSGVFLFFLVPVWFGFSPTGVAVALVLNLLYQFWLHTELIGKLGWFEWAFNTPSHHRVHHAMNPRYIDKNYGGVLILFDRLFGTFAEERDDEPCRFGLVKPVPSRNPFVIAFYEWYRMVLDLRRARGWREVLGYLFGRPGWQPARAQAEGPASTASTSPQT